MLTDNENECQPEQMSMFGQDLCAGKMYPEPSAQTTPGTSGSSLKKSRGSLTAEYLCLDLRTGAGNLLGQFWEINSPSLGVFWTLNTGEKPHSGGGESSLSRILEASPPPKYYLSRAACLGILRRARERGKQLPHQLEAALKIQSGIVGES
jgi:hypothetical protein